MRKLFSAIHNLAIQSFLAIGLASLILTINLFVPQPGYAAARIVGVASPLENQGSKEVIQPFELTRPAETREEAYEETAKLTKNPKELIKAENKEEKAQEELLKAEEQAAK